MGKNNHESMEGNYSFQKAIKILHVAKQNGIEIVLDGVDLQLKSRQDKDIPAGLIADIRENKQLLIDFLGNSNWQSKNQ